MINRQSDQRGLAHVALIAIVVVLAGAIGFAAWRVSSNKTLGGSPVVNKEVQSACLKELNDKNFCKFASSFNLKASYKSSITTTSADGTSVSNLNSDGKDNSSMTVLQNGKEIMASISLNGDSYIKDEANGVWIKYPKSTESKPETTDPTSNIDIKTDDFTAKSTITYKYLSKEACGKLSCFKYQLVDKNAPDSTQYIWFDDKDYQMQRWYSKEAGDTTDMIFVYTKVTISAPSPVKEFSAASSADIQAASDAAAAAAAAMNASTDQGSTDTSTTDYSTDTQQ